MQGLISAAFLLFILLTSNPFERLAPAPFEGRDLNPILQDPGLAIHPPMLYLGYVGFSIVFSFAAAALIEGRIDAAWARFVRPFALVAWGFLTIGIAARLVLGLLHARLGRLVVLGPGRERLAHAVAGGHGLHPFGRGDGEARRAEGLDDLPRHPRLLVLAARHLPRALGRADLGARLRQRPARGVFILAILGVFIVGSFALFAWRAPLLKQGGLFAPISREGALVLNNLLLTTACATVFFGTLYPLALEQLTGEKITVGAPFFNMTCGVALARRCCS